MNNDLAMYGVDDMTAYFEEAKASMTYRFIGGFMLVASLMSDAQELMAYGNIEEARQTLNCAKYLQFKIAAGEMEFKTERVEA
jgi:hypothetical protein